MTRTFDSADHCCTAADISELNLAKADTILFPEGQDKLLHFQITMRPKEGIYRRVVAPH